MGTRGAAIVVCALAMTMIAGAGSAEDGVEDDRIVFGQSAALSGPAAELGLEMRRGIMAAFAEANATGGVEGRRIDLVARDGNDTVFVEVKTRSSTAFGHPFEAITPQKLARLRRLANAWCDAHPYRRGVIRIDAISVIAAAGAAPLIEHLRRVF